MGSYFTAYAQVQVFTTVADRKRSIVERLGIELHAISKGYLCELALAVQCDT